MTIKSLTDCELFIINRDALRDLLYFYPESEFLQRWVAAVLYACILVVGDSVRNMIQVSIRRLLERDILFQPEEVIQSSNMEYVYKYVIVMTM